MSTPANKAKAKTLRQRVEEKFRQLTAESKKIAAGTPTPTPPGGGYVGAGGLRGENRNRAREILLREMTGDPAYDEER